MVTIEISVKDEKGVEIKSSSFPELETGLSERGIEENKINIINRIQSLYAHDLHIKLIKKAASINISLARYYLNHISGNAEKAVAFMEVSKDQPQEIAQQLLNEAKEAIGSDSFAYSEIMLEIYQEEKKRNFDSFSDTIMDLKHSIQKFVIQSGYEKMVFPYSLTKLARVEFELKDENLDKTLSTAIKIIKKNIKFEEKKNSFIDLLKELGKFATQANPAIIQDFIELFKKYISYIDSQDYGLDPKNNPPFNYEPADVQKARSLLRAWYNLLSFEIDLSNHDYFKNDQKSYLSLIKSLKKVNPEMSEECDIQLRLLVEDLLRLRVNPFSKEPDDLLKLNLLKMENIKLVTPFLEEIQDPYEQWEAKTFIFLAHTKMPNSQKGFNKEKEFKKLKDEAFEKFPNVLKVYFDLYDLSKKTFELEKALPFLEQARELIGKNDDIDEKNDQYMDLFMIETIDRLQSRIDTLRLMKIDNIFEDKDKGDSYEEITITRLTKELIKDEPELYKSIIEHFIFPKNFG